MERDCFHFFRHESSQGEDFNDHASRALQMLAQFGNKQKMLKFLEILLRYIYNARNECVAHYHEERNYQGKGNALLFPADDYDLAKQIGMVKCRKHLKSFLLAISF